MPLFRNVRSKGVEPVFAILIVGAARVGEIRWYVEELLEKVALPFLIDGIRFDLSACAGVSVYPDDGTTYSQLLSHAEAAIVVAPAKPDTTSFV